MRANLAYIHETVNAALDEQEREQKLPLSVGKAPQRSGLKIIAGLEVYDASEVLAQQDLQFTQRRYWVKQYRKHRNELSEKLCNIRVSPLAILPKAAWGRICTLSGLYRMSPDSYGRVDVDVTEQMHSIDHRATILNPLVWAVVAIAYVVMGVYIGHSIIGDVFGKVIFAMGFLFTVVSPIAMVLAHDVVVRRAYRWSRAVLVRLLCACCNFNIRERIIQNPALLHGKKRTTGQATLVLPAPPPEVAEILLRAYAHLDGLKVAAVGEAIAFLESPGQILRNTALRLEAERAEQRRIEQELIERLNDPIVYYEYESAVAIIAQFGDFPIEKEVIDKVVSSEHLI